jgi:hypothetical protein
MRSPRAGPRLADAAARNQVVGRPRQEQQQGSPVVSVGFRLDGESTDQSLVKQRGQLADGRIGAKRRAPINGEEIAVNSEFHRTIASQSARGGDQPRQQGRDCRMRARVQRDCARGRLAGSSKVS